jgi:hypothetical protein
MVNESWGLGHYFFDIISLPNGDIECFTNLKSYFVKGIPILAEQI